MEDRQDIETVMIPEISPPDGLLQDHDDDADIRISDDDLIDLDNLDAGPEEDLAGDPSDDDHGREWRDRFVAAGVARERSEQLRQEQEQFKNRWFNIARLMSAKRIVAGKVEGIETVNSEKGATVCVVTSHQGFEIYIPFDEFFLIPNEVIKSSDLNLADPKDRRIYRRKQENYVSRMLGAEIGFVITEIKDPDFNTMKGYEVHASRKQEREMWQQYNFNNHPVRGEKDKVVWMRQVGDLVDANIMAVYNSFVRVDVAGVDCTIRAEKLTYRYCSDLRSLYRTGQKVKVQITKIIPRKDGFYEMNASGIAVEHLTHMETNPEIRVGRIIKAIYQRTTINKTGYKEVAAYCETLNAPVYATNFSPAQYYKTLVPGDVLTCKIKKISEYGRILVDVSDREFIVSERR